MTARRPVVIKLGGRALESPGAPAQLAAEVAALRTPAVVVHGGGRDVSAWCERLGIAPRFIDGLRVTDAATLEVATAVLAGLANARLVAQLRAAGVDAVGLSALDGGIAAVESHPDAATLGRVGVVTGIDAALLETLLAQGRVPVLASIGAQDRELLNLNADELAAALAGALRSATLLLLSDAPGVVIDGEVVPELGPGALERLLDHPQVQGGMVAKLEAARKAIAAGAGRVVIAAWQGPGTLASLLEGNARGTTLAARANGTPHATTPADLATAATPQPGPATRAPERKDS